MRKIIVEHHEPDQYSVILHQQGKNRFLVQYGLQIKGDLTYEEAAQEFGACVMHAAACNGKITD